MHNQAYNINILSIINRIFSPPNTFMKIVIKSKIIQFKYA